MFGKPKDVEGQCNKWLILGDDYGDGDCTFRCQKKRGHRGPHRETSGRFTIEWTRNDRPAYERLLKRENRLIAEMEQEAKNAT